MDSQTLAAYNAAAQAFAAEWHQQPPPTDLHDYVTRFFQPGLTADIERARAALLEALDLAELI